MLLLVRTKEFLPKTQALWPKALGFAIAHTSACFKPFEVSSIDGLFITSQAALTALPKSFPKDIPLYCVGTATHHAAEKLDFQHIFTPCEGAAMDMAKAFVQEERPKGTYLHLHGDYADLNWHTLIQNAGHTITGLQVYETQYVQALPEDLLTAFQEKQITDVALFSAQAAKHLLFLCHQANISPSFVTAWCLSPAVAQAAQGFKAAFAAPKPTLKEMKLWMEAQNHGQ